VAEFDELLAEPFIKGHELTVAVLGDSAAVTELKPPRLLRLRRQIYGRADAACLPGEIPDDVRDAAMAMALKAHQLLGCEGTSRSDFRWDDERGVEGLYLLEVNTQPA
jgi:D-alanine-D-alanine ligase